LTDVPFVGFVGTKRLAVAEALLRGDRHMAAIDMLVFVTAAGFAVVVTATILVIIGVHQEERRGTLARKPPPTIPALLARRILGTYIQLLPRDQPGLDDPGQPPPNTDDSPAPRDTTAGRWPGP
jgi:hypothetical protein